MPTAAHLRPTPDRVRETLFNWLNHLWAGQFQDKRVLDLFAGTGALGFEAASRGAGHVQLVEAARPVAAALRATREQLQAEAVHIHVGDAVQFLRDHPRPDYDLLLLDPPFGADWTARLAPLLGRALAPDGLLYLETERGAHMAPTGWETLREGRAGQVRFRLLQFAAQQTDGE